MIDSFNPNASLLEANSLQPLHQQKTYCKVGLFRKIFTVRDLDLCKKIVYTIELHSNQLFVNIL